MSNRLKMEDWSDNRKNQTQVSNGFITIRHLILGASNEETQIQSYVKEHSDVQVVCLCKDPIIKPKPTEVGTYWECDFNQRETWEELLLNFGESSFTKIIFDSSTSKFINSNFWNLKTGYFSLINRLLVPEGKLYFDSFHLGTVCYPNTLAEDLATTGQTTGTLSLLPLIVENSVYIIQTLESLSRRDKDHSFEALEDRIFHSDDLALYLDRLHKYSAFGSFNIKDTSTDSYPIANTVYSIKRYIVYSKHNHLHYD